MQIGQPKVGGMAMQAEPGAIVSEFFQVGLPPDGLAGAHFQGAEDAVAVHQAAIGHRQAIRREAVDQAARRHGVDLWLEPDNGMATDMMIDRVGTPEVDQTFLKMSVLLVPPKPKEFDMATSTFACRPVLAT